MFSLNFHTQLLEKKYKIFALKRFLKKTRIQFIGNFVILILVCLSIMIADGSTQAVLTNLGFIVLMGIGVSFSLTKIFSAYSWISLMSILIMAIASTVFNSIVRGTEFTMLYVVVLIGFTTNYSITYSNVRYLFLLHAAGYIFV